MNSINSSLTQIEAQTEGREVEVLFVNPPLDSYRGEDAGLYKTLPPFGLGMLATLTAMTGHTAAILDAEALRLSTTSVAEIIDGVAPRVLGLTTTSPSMGLLHEILTRTRHQPELTIAGGVHATVMPADTVTRLGRVDGVFLGEAEHAWSLFLDRLHASREALSEKILEGIPGVFVRQTGMSNPGIYSALDILPNIDRRYFVNDPYPYRGAWQSGVLSSRGCPFSCNYCAASAFRQHGVRYRPVEKLVDEVEELAVRGTTYLHFGDDTFTLSHKRMAAFRTALAKRNLRIRWKAFSRAAGLSEAALDDMAESGCYKLTFGVESGSDEVLRLMNKHQTARDVERVIQWCRSRGIVTKGFFMLGYPGERRSQIRETVDFAIGSGLDEAFFYVVRAFPGTQLFSQLEQNGHQREDLLKYQHVWPTIHDCDLSPEQLRVKQHLEEQSIFDISKTLKYNITHQKSISHISIEDLCDEMARAYIHFYYRKERLTA